MKVYILEEDFGEYDDAYTTIHSVYDSLEKAEQAKAKLEDYHNNPVNPYPEMSMEDISNYLFNGEVGTKTTEKESKLEGYYDKVMYNDFNCCHITEKEVL